VAVEANYAYVADGNKGLRIIDISQPSQPTEIGFYDTNGYARDVFLSGDYAFVADLQGGLRVIDVSNPDQPVEVGFYQNCYANGVVAQGDYAFVAGGPRGLRVIDVSQPTQPKEVGFYDTGGSAYNVTVSGNSAYVADVNDGLYILDISEVLPLLPDHWNFTANTGNNATVVLPASANPNIDGATLANDDYVGVFTSTGLCCGLSQWQGQNVAITVWGDDDQTSEIDGFQPGESISYRVYRLNEEKEWTSAAVDYSQGNGVYSANAFMVLSQFDVATTSVNDQNGSSLTPASFKLFQNYPNPFNPETTIKYHLTKTSEVVLTIYDTQGHEVINLDQGTKSPGSYKVKWVGKNRSGESVASGIYFYRIRIKSKGNGKESYVDVRKMIFMR